MARHEGLRFRVYSAARWPEGSRCVFESAADIDGAFSAVARRGVWFELGERFELPSAKDVVTTPALGRRAGTVFRALLPVLERLAA